MARILFAAHDFGGANLLDPVAEACQTEGHVVRRVAHGPARALWGGASRTVLAEMRAFAPDLAVTGTSENVDFEQTLWRRAREFDVGTIAAIDAWMNLSDRFLRSPDGVQPDALLVIDEEMKREIKRAGWCRARLYVGGQPHLEHQATHIRQRRADRRPNAPPVVAFFSEPIAGTAAADRIGYDQFRVAGMITDGLAKLAPAGFLIQPHPKEKMSPWRNWLTDQSFPPGLDVEVSERATEELLVATDAVAGMSTMVVIEAAVAGIPVLAVQPQRNYCPNPAIDAMLEIRLVIDPADLTDALNEALTAGRRINSANGFEGSTEACLSAIETELRITR